MFNTRNCSIVLALAAVGAFVIAACNSLSNLSNLPSGNNLTSAQDDGQTISEGRKTAGRVLHTALNAIRMDILQFDPLVLTQNRCFPLGDGAAITPWVSTIEGGAAALLPATSTSEYDFLTTSLPNLETDYITSIRAIKPDASDSFTALEFNFRAVDPFVTGHVPHTNYLIHQADFPSNDDDVGDRSLCNMAGGDVAIVVYGINFNSVLFPGNTPNNTSAYMNFLGTNAYLTFMRDNAIQSGRFYAIAGAVTGSPKALSEPGAPPSPGFFNSVQVNGTNFDGLTEPFSKVSVPFGAPVPALPALPPVPVVGGIPRPQMCVGGSPAAISFGGYLIAQYAFADLSHIGHLGGTGPGFTGLGGFVLVIRNDAFQDPIAVPENVVLDPSANPGFEPGNANQIPAPISGFNETTPPFTAPLPPSDLTNNSGSGAKGCHEIGVSVFFIHS